MQRTTRALGEAVLEIGPTSKENSNVDTVIASDKEKGAKKFFWTKGSSAKASSTKVDDSARIEEFIRKRPTDITRDPRYRNAVLRIGERLLRSWRIIH